MTNERKRRRKRRRPSPGLEEGELEEHELPKFVRQKIQILEASDGVADELGARPALPNPQRRAEISQRVFQLAARGGEEKRFALHILDLCHRLK